MRPNPLKQSRYHYQHRHMWHVPRGYSIIDAALDRVLMLTAFSLPLEGILQDFTGSTGRSLAFYFGFLAAGLAFLRVPQVLHNVGNAQGYVLLIITYTWTFVLYYYYPLIENTTNVLLVKLIILGVIFLYAADRRDLRKRLISAYWLGWALLVIWSLNNYLNGDYQLWERGAVVRVVQVSGYTANQHARQIAGGMMVTLSLILSTHRVTVRFVGICILLGAGFVLLATNSRGGIFSLLLTIGLFFVVQRVHSGASRRFAMLSTMSVVLMIGLYYIFFETANGQRFWSSFVVRVNETFYAEGAVTREKIAQAAIDIFWDRPFGVGQQNAQAFLRERLGSAFDPHNYYLRILVEGGLPGVILFGAGLYMVLCSGWHWLVSSGEDVFFWPLIYFLIAAATGRDFHFKVLWFFLAMNALTPPVTMGQGHKVKMLSSQFDVSSRQR